LDTATISNSSVTFYGLTTTSGGGKMAVRGRKEDEPQHATSAESSAVKMQEYLEIQAVFTESP
jgi:hypothetical protein